MEFISHLSDLELVDAVASNINARLPAYIRFPMKAQGEGLPGPSDHVGVLCGVYYNGIHENFTMHCIVKYNDPLTNIRDSEEGKGKTADILPKNQRQLKTFTLNGFANTCYFDTDVLGKYSHEFMYRRHAPSYCELKTTEGYVRMDKLIPKFLFRYGGGYRQEIARWLQKGYNAIEKIDEPLLVATYAIKGPPHMCKIEAKNRSTLAGRGKNKKPPRSAKRKMEKANDIIPPPLPALSSDDDELFIDDGENALRNLRYLYKDDSELSDDHSTKRKKI